MSMIRKLFGIGRNMEYDKGIRLFDQGLYREAIELLELSTKVNGSRVDALTQKLAGFYIGEAYSHVGQEALKHENWQESAEAFRNALKIHPNYADIHHNLAVALRHLGEMEDALNCVDASLKINPRYAQAHVTKAIVKYELKQYDEAMEALTRAIEIEPGLNTEVCERVFELHSEGSYKGALVALEQVTNTQIEDILFHFKLGDDYYRRGLYAESAMEYLRSLALSPNYADIHNHLGLAYHAQEMYPQAIESYTRALDINPTFENAMVNRAIAYRDSGQLNLAIDQFKAISEIFPENLVTIENLKTLVLHAAA